MEAVGARHIAPNEAGASGQDDGLAPVGDLELGEDRGDVAGDGLITDGYEIGMSAARESLSQGC
jgi:hypothetical protein